MFALTVTVHEPVPEHPPPLHPANVEPVLGVALKVPEVPGLTSTEQTEPQLIEPPPEVTRPEPVPGLVMERVNWVGEGDGEPPYSYAPMSHAPLAGRFNDVRFPALVVSLSRINKP